MEASQLPGAVKGKGGESALEFGGGGVAVAVCFCFWGAGASQLPGCEGGNVLSQLWSLVAVASPSSLSSSCCLFLFWGAGASQLPGL